MEEIAGYTGYILVDNELIPKIIPFELKDSFNLFIKELKRLPTEVEFNKWYLYNKQE